MVTVVDYKPLDNISGFQILTDNNQKFLTWDNRQYKFPIGPQGFIPKSGICFYDVLRSVCAHKKVLDLGCGELGIISLFALQNKANKVTAIDIDSRCVNWLSHIQKEYGLHNLEVFISDMFQNVNDKYDIIVSNPPIMPMENIDTQTVHDAGGKDGRLYLYKIIKEAYSYLNEKGSLYLSAFSFLGTDVQTGKQETIKEYAQSLGYRHFNVIKKVLKTLSPSSVTYQQLPYIKKIYPYMKDIKCGEKTAVEFQILQIQK